MYTPSWNPLRRLFECGVDGAGASGWCIRNYKILSSRPCRPVKTGAGDGRRCGAQPAFGRDRRRAGAILVVAPASIVHEMVETGAEHVGHRVRMCVGFAVCALVLRKRVAGCGERGRDQVACGRMRGVEAADAAFPCRAAPGQRFIVRNIPLQVAQQRGAETRPGTARDAHAPCRASRLRPRPERASGSRSGRARRRRTAYCGRAVRAPRRCAGARAGRGSRRTGGRTR